MTKYNTIKLHTIIYANKKLSNPRLRKNSVTKEKKTTNNNLGIHAVAARVWGTARTPTLPKLKLLGNGRNNVY